MRSHIYASLNKVFLGFWFYEAILHQENFDWDEEGNIYCFQQFFICRKYTAT